MLTNNKSNVTWTRYNKDYYVSKGYEFTEIGKVFEVNINDLPSKDTHDVDLKCDRCNTVMNWNYDVYLRNMETWQGTYCRECKKILRTGYPTINPSYDYYFRLHIKPWYIDSINSCNGLCVITGKPTTIVHHKYSLKRIIYETLQHFGIEDMLKNIEYDYNSLFMKTMAKKCLELHYEHGLGACLIKDMHLEFHSLYGNGNCSPEQFEEFKRLKLKRMVDYAYK
jgi:hypothetical protein